MPNSITYNQLVTALSNLLVDQGPSDDFTGILPFAIQQAEERIQRALDFLNYRLVDSTVLLVNGTRSATVPSTFNVVEGISVFTPASSHTTRIQLERVSQDYLDFSYPTDTTKARPVNYSLLTDTTINLGPVPDAGYYIEITGTGQPAPMSAANQTTYIGNNFPDLLLAACMVFMSVWQRDNGGGGSPGDSDTWNATYNTLFKDAEEFVERQKSQDPGWTPYAPAPLVAPRT